MATLKLRLVEGRPLTNFEVDSNFTNLNNDKLELSGGTLSGTLNLAAGSTSNPPLHFNSTTSTVLTNASKGSMEYDSSTGKLYFTPIDTRKEIAFLGSIALGTDTSGNYVSTIAGTSNQITVTGSGSEAASVTLSTPQDIATTSNVRFRSIGVGIAASGTSGRIDAADDVVAYSSSDARLKTDIEKITDALEKVKSLNGVTFTWDEAQKDIHGYTGKDTGVIAQDVEKVLPEVVTTRDNGFMAVKYEKMIGLLVEAIKELDAKLEKCNCGK